MNQLIVVLFRNVVIEYDAVHLCFYHIKLPIDIACDAISKRINFSKQV